MKHSKLLNNMGGGKGKGVKKNNRRSKCEKNNIFIGEIP
jgi:hypothetical protein